MPRIKGGNNRTLSRRLDTRVQIQHEPDPENAAIQSSSGEVSQAEVNWGDGGTCWAEILPDAGGELTIGGQAVGDQRYKVTVRRRNDLKLSDRLKVLSGKLTGLFLYVEAEARAERDEEQAVICRQGKRG